MNNYTRAEMMREIQSLLISFLVMFLITFNLNVLPVEAQAAVERLTIGSFNVENLDPSDNLRFKQIAKIIVNDLNAPDILALIEVQDDNGKIDDTVTTANLTYKTLTTAIKTEGGPVYQFSDISPVDDLDGGEPGGNIRVGYIYNPAKVSLAQGQSGGSQDAVEVILKNGSVSLSRNPSRIQPNSPAFENSRKPLAGEFVVGNKKVFIIANHFVSKSNNNNKESQRIQQAQIVEDFVSQILAKDSQSNIVVVGDLNDGPNSTTLRTLTDRTLVNLPVKLLPPDDAYSYIFQGRKQLIDYILVNQQLAQTNPRIRIAHVNANQPRNSRASDHDPLVATINLTSGQNPGANPIVIPSGTSSNIFPSLKGLSLQEEIRQSYSPTRTIGYGAARDKMFGDIDNQNGKVIDIYGGRVITLDDGNDPSQAAGSQGFNTEHSWPQSKGAGQEPQRSDLHHLFPSDAKINGERGNKVFAEIPDDKTKKWLKGDISQTNKPTASINEFSESTNSLFEPRESVKGDLARAVFYFYTIHKSQADDSYFAEQKQTLCNWNKLDPPSSTEIARSNSIAALQGNENPFVIDATLPERAYCNLT
ncbi:endonuclease [Dolichospermum sp. UHCC 0315A]|uniref:endonuclease n=2 Tax=Dolichospermum TaxID=748770 RepID=UPI001FEF2E11|nr:endonuclease [Dolichospermum sp. UHCC 0315A]